MKADDIHLNDIQRILVGDVPGGFYIELLIRLVVIFMLVIAGMRLMGKRTAGQLNRNELASLVSLAAAVGVAIQSPDKGLLPAMVVVIVILIVGRLVARISYSHQRFEKAAQGNVSTLIKDSVLQIKTMERTKISRERVFAELRIHELKNLGAVKRLYLEAGGMFTLVKNEPEQPGLSVVPDWDRDLNNEQEKEPLTICGYCGFRRRTEQEKCPNCDHACWTKAIK